MSEGRLYLTGELPGTGGLLKAVPEDFEVEEVPAYLPSGEGEHLFMWVEKVGRNTQDVVRALAQVAGVDEREIGYAGMKDRQGVTRQFFSVPARTEAKVASFAQPGMRVLEAKRHGNKLRTGHLRGNRFRIRLRDVPEEALARAEAILARLRTVGVPNAFGDQRFGRADDNAEQGRKLVLGERLARAPSAFQRKLYLSAFQSLLFNRALAARLRTATLAQARAGDVLRKTDSGGVFVCEDPAVDQPRVDRFEVSPTGPLFGPKMVQAAGEVRAFEEALLQEAGVTLDDFRRGKGETEGGRRPFRVPLEDASVTPVPDAPDLLLAFTLPKGSYATVVLGEVMKSSVALATSSSSGSDDLP